MKKQKEYTVVCVHGNKELKYTGTLEYLLDDVFGYTLVYGHDLEESIILEPKTIKSLISMLNRIYEIKQWEDYYYLG